MNGEENDVNEAAQRLETIQALFIQAQEMAQQQPDLNILVPRLNAVDPLYRSIAFEAASMCLAIKDLEQGNQLQTWRGFINGAAAEHAIQVHLGLGWAFAQQMANPLPYLPTLHPMMRYRVFDGYGYYEGLFRRRKSIMAQQPFECEDKVAASTYDQGLGRSIWYIAKGDLSAAVKMIESFPPERKPHLWRGVGIACSYAGGCNQQKLAEIFAAAGTYQSSLSAGAAMVGVSRQKAGYLTPHLELTCRVWCNISAAEAANLANKTATGITGDDFILYPRWVAALEAGLTAG